MATLILANARNRRVNAFQKMFGIWLFANSAAYGMYQVLCRMGLTVSYTTVLRSLRHLAKGASGNAQELAKTSKFIVIYDNINRTRTMYSTESPTRSKLLSGCLSLPFVRSESVR